jgi:hypothetical protein
VAGRSSPGRKAPEKMLCGRFDQRFLRKNNNTVIIEKVVFPFDVVGIEESCPSPLFVIRFWLMIILFLIGRLRRA